MAKVKELTALKCKFRDFTKYQTLFPDDVGKTKEGYYHGTYFWNIPKFGMKKWVIVTHIVDVDVDSLIKEGREESEIVTACIEYLNVLPKRKKYAKKAPRRPYGNLELFRSSIKEDKEGKKYISVLLTTDERKNKAFWNEGQKVNRVRKWGNK